MYIVLYMYMAALTMSYISCIQYNGVGAWVADCSCQYRISPVCWVSVLYYFQTLGCLSQYHCIHDVCESVIGRV